MKKNTTHSIVVTLLLLAAFINTNAQQFGLRFGSSFSFLTGDTGLGAGKPGLMLGGVINYPLSDALLITGGIDYNQLRVSVSDLPHTFEDGTLWLKQSDISFHTIEASGLAGYKLPLAFLGDAAPFVVGGLSMAYNAGTWDQFEIKQIRNDQISTLTGNENVKSLGTPWLAAWQAGLRFETSLDGGLFSRMLVDVRFRNSLNSVMNTFPLNGSVVQPGMRTASVSLGFMF